jgi:acetyltransferase
MLGEEEAREILEAYGFAFPGHAFADTSRAASEAFRALGSGKVVMKIVSPDILHKTDVGGVRLSLSSEEEVARAFVEITSAVRRRAPSAWVAGVSVQEMVEGGREVILGMSRDPQFGPLLMFGMGGIYVEVMKDVSFRVAPLSRRDAEEMVREIRSYPLLASFRGIGPADEEAVVEALLRVSRLATDFPEIQELDINPLLALPRGRGVRAIDCRMTIAEGT